MIEFGLLLIGLVVVVIGAELVVRGGSRVAARLGVSPMIIGVTVVAVGTSTPELAVGIEAALQGAGSLAIGNIAGTNTLNLLFILGLVALLRPLPLRSQVIRLDLPVMVVAATVMYLLALDGDYSRLDGAVLLVLGIIYTTLVMRVARRESFETRAEYAREYGDHRSRSAAGSDTASTPAPAPGAPSLSVSAPNGHPLRHAVMLVAGIVIIVIGADWLVDGAEGVARNLGVSDALIGLTVVAIGTSAPELVTAIVSTIRKERDIAVGNLIGSSVYNIVIIFGITALVPPNGIPVDQNFILIDLPVMVAATVVCIPVFLTGARIQRAEGGLFVLAYLAYLTTLVVTRT